MALALSGGLAAASTAVAAQTATRYGLWGVDLSIMEALGRRWLATGSMYTPAQLAGPYSVLVTPSLADTPGLYPPAAGPLFAAFALMPPPLAAALWWGVPLAVLAWCARAWRPGPLGWALALLCLAWPQTALQAAVGGTTLWLAAAVGAGLRWGGWGALVLLKPTLLPFAIAGIRSRWWWAVAALVAALTLAGPWLDYVAVVRNAQDGGGLLYSLGQAPVLLLPVALWAGRR